LFSAFAQSIVIALIALPLFLLMLSTLLIPVPGTYLPFSSKRSSPTAICPPIAWYAQSAKLPSASGFNPTLTAH